jgi:general stress protein 26
MRLTKSELHAFLETQRYAVIATTADDGCPQSALVGFAVTEDLDIVFDTLAATRKVTNIRSRPAVSLVIGQDRERSAQIEGFADEPMGEELSRLKTAYCAKWPSGLERVTWDTLVYIRVRVTWCRFSDFNRELDPVRELTLY